MTKQKDIYRKNEIKKFSEIVANWINASSLVDDNWINAIKTYHAVELSDEDTVRIRMLIICMYIDLSLARIEDLLETRERVAFERDVIDHISYINSLISTKEKTKGVGVMENSIYDLLEIYRTNQKQQNLTIAQNYLAYLANPDHVTNLPQEVWAEYINTQINEFEKRDFRLQLSKILDSISRSHS